MSRTWRRLGSGVRERTLTLALVAFFVREYFGVRGPMSHLLSAQAITCLGRGAVLRDTVRQPAQRERQIATSDGFAA